MTTMPSLVITLLLLGFTGDFATGGQGNPQAPAPPAPPAAPADAAKSIQLFPEREKVLDLLQNRLQKHADMAGRPSSTVVCGMTVIAADPGIDPKIVHPVPEDAANYKIRRIEPPVCNQPAPGR